VGKNTVEVHSPDAGNGSHFINSPANLMATLEYITTFAPEYDM